MTKPTLKPRRGGTSAPRSAITRGCADKGSRRTLAAAGVDALAAHMERVELRESSVDVDTLVSSMGQVGLRPTLSSQRPSLRVSALAPRRSGQRSVSRLRPTMRNTTVDKTQVIFAKGRDLLERSAPRMGLALLLQINPEQLRPPQQKEWLGLLWANRDQGTERGDLCWKVAACLAKNRERLDVGAQREFGDWLEQAAQALFREGQPSGATLRLVKQAIADCGMRTDALCRAYGEACVRLAAEAIAPVAGPSSLEHTQLSTEVCLTQLRDAVRVAEHDLELTASIGAVAMQGWAQLGSRVPALRDTVSPEVLYSFLQSIRDAALRIDWWTPEQRIAAVTEPYNQLVGQLQTEDVADALDALKLS